MGLYTDTEGRAEQVRCTVRSEREGHGDRQQAECGPLQKVQQAWHLPRETNLSLPRICRDEARQFQANGLISHFSCVKLS